MDIITQQLDKNIPEPLKSTREIKRYCSWCLDLTFHICERDHILGRGSYRCETCLNETSPCYICTEGMTRRYPAEADKMCFRCSNIIQEWNKSEFKKLTIVLNCSWCFQKVHHKVYQVNTITRDTYICTNCVHKTLKCINCSDGAARGHSTYSDELCIKCDGTIESWGIKNKSKIIKEGWCSWCADKTQHELQQKNIVRRHIYRCTSCQNRTLICVKCKGNFARGGVGWDDNTCISCGTLPQFVHSNEGWDKIKAKKDIVFSKNQDILEQLKRSSEFKEKARHEGVLRPFLLLLALPPPMRDRVANLLGWSLITSDCFGDPHHEAWEIINKNGIGLQARCNASYEKINPFAHNCNWYDILYRVVQTMCGTVTSMPNLGFGESMKLLNSKDNEIVKLEEEFLVFLATTTQKVKYWKDASLDEILVKLNDENPVHVEKQTDEIPESPTQGDDQRDFKPPIVELQKNIENEKPSEESNNLGDTITDDKKLKKQLENPKPNSQTNEIQNPKQNEAVATLSPEQIQVLTERLKSCSGMNRVEVINYAINITKSALQISPISTSIVALNSTATFAPSLAGVLLPVSNALASLSTLLTPLAIIGLVGLATTGIKIALGTSEGRLLGPLSVILSNNLILALHGINLHDFE